MLNSVPHDTAFSETLVFMVPGRLGSSNEFKILAAKRVTLLRREVRERHPERAAKLGVQVVDRARETVRRKPLDHRIRIQESAIDTLRRGPQYAVKTNSTSSHDARAPFSSGFPAIDPSYIAEPRAVSGARQFSLRDFSR
jgi:hypothetical protein